MTLHVQDWIAHKLLHRPYQLHCRFDVGQGQTVVFLHGIGGSGENWRHVESLLRGYPVRAIALDLLGFGRSVKPTDDWVMYSAADHARAVIATLEKLGVKGPISIVGHSMGCFVAVEVATLKKGYVKELLLYEPPFYVGLPNKNSYKLRLATYFKIYESFTETPPKALKYFSKAQRLFRTGDGFDVNEDNWIPFQRSVRNTIMKQTALDDLKRLKVPTQILYGRYDHLVFNDKDNVLFQNSDAPVEVAELSALHGVSKRASKEIVRRLLPKLGIDIDAVNDARYVRDTTLH